MRKQMEDRLQVLRQEFETGQSRLTELEAQAAQLRQTLLRISGAIQVIEELLLAAPEEPPADSHT